MLPRCENIASTRANHQGEILAYRDEPLTGRFFIFIYQVGSSLISMFRESRYRREQPSEVQSFRGCHIHLADQSFM